MIFHYSHAPIRKEIESSGFIGLEGCRLEYFIDAGLIWGNPCSLNAINGEAAKRI